MTLFLWEITSRSEKFRSHTWENLFLARVKLKFKRVPLSDRRFSRVVLNNRANRFLHVARVYSWTCSAKTSGGPKQLGPKPLSRDFLFRTSRARVNEWICFLAAPLVRFDRKLRLSKLHPSIGFVFFRVRIVNYTPKFFLEENRVKNKEHIRQIKYFKLYTTERWKIRKMREIVKYIHWKINYSKEIEYEVYVIYYNRMIHSFHANDIFNYVSDARADNTWSLINANCNRRDFISNCRAFELAKQAFAIS